MRKEIDIVYLHIKKLAIVLHLQYRGYDAELVTPEDTDVPLRVRRINAIALKYGISNTMAISIHVNAAGIGKEWMNARGWCAYTFPEHTESDGHPDIEQPFYILKHTYCAAMLSENGFMYCEFSLAYLESDAGKKAITALHVDGIIDFVEKRKHEPL